MASSINASTTAGVVTTADTSGVLNIQTAGTTAIAIDASQNATFTNSANLPNTFGFKNRIINGAMDIDQRNAGASVSLTSGGGIGYPVDRWYVENFTDGTATVQQVADAPTGFSNSIRYTVTATDTSLASDQSAFMQQRIEGFNFADMAFGTASAKTVTVSFWVKSSVTGAFGVVLENSAYNRGYPASFTVNTANTWEQKTATITGDTTGTWIGATSGVGVRVTFAVAAGSARVASAGAWSASTVIGVSGQSNLMATNGATFQITGVQVEVGTVATSFDFRDYGRELILCQRYYEVIPMTGMTGTAGGGTLIAFSRPYLVQKRATPTVAIRSGTSANFNAFRPLIEAANSGPVVSTSIGDAATFTVELDGYSGLTNNNSWSGRYSAGTFSASAEL